MQNITFKYILQKKKIEKEKESKWISICKPKSSDGSKSGCIVPYSGGSCALAALYAQCFLCFLLEGYFFLPNMQLFFFSLSGT